MECPQDVERCAVRFVMKSTHRTVMKIYKMCEHLLVSMSLKFAYEKYLHKFTSKLRKIKWRCLRTLTVSTGHLQGNH